LFDCCIVHGEFLENSRLSRVPDLPLVELYHIGFDVVKSLD
jgi:hypothetical protein